MFFTLHDNMSQVMAGLVAGQKDSSKKKSTKDAMITKDTDETEE